VILNTDIPTRAQVDRLIAARSPASVSIDLATDPASTGAAERIELKNLASEAVDQLRRAGAGRDQIAAIDEEFTDLVEDEEFLRHQAHCAAVFATPNSLTTFRLPHRLTSMVEVSDRFHIKPLLRAVTFPQLAFVLALAQGSVRLILAASEPIATIFRSVNSCPGLASETIPGNWETQSYAELAQRARAILDRLYVEQLREVRELLALRASEQRAAADVAEVARVATYGVADEIARRVWFAGGRALAVRRDDILGREPVAAILRYVSP
jgi:Bacterial archaeo-eukaryotic release factor family 8